MRQQISTLVTVVAIMTLLVESFLVYLNATEGAPLLRMVCFVVLALHILNTGELNRREYEAKRRKIKKLKDELKRNSIIDDYKAFYAEMHGGDIK